MVLKNLIQTLTNISMTLSRPSPQQAMLRTLRRNQEERAAIMNVLNERETEQQRRQQETQETGETAQVRRGFFDHVLQSYGGDEEEMLRAVAVNSTFFFSVLNVVNSIRLPNRGRPGFVHSHRDKLLFLIMFLKEGSKALSNACLQVIRDPSTIMRNLHQVVRLIKEFLSETWSSSAESVWTRIRSSHPSWTAPLSKLQARISISARRMSTIPGNIRNTVLRRRSS